MASVQVTEGPLRTSRARYSLSATTLERATRNVNSASSLFPPLRRELAAHATPANMAGKGQSRTMWCTEPPAFLVSAICTQAVDIATKENRSGRRLLVFQRKGAITSAPSIIG